MSDATTAELAYLARALKAPRIRAVAARLAQRAREEGWDHEAYLAWLTDRRGGSPTLH